MPVAIFDMDGVLYRGSVVMPHARETVDRLRGAGWQVFFATNNSTASRADYVKRLTGLALGSDEEHVITSAYATAHYLARLDPKPRDVFVVGADGLRAEIAAVGISARPAGALPGAHPPANAAADGVSAAAMREYLTHLDLPPIPDAVVVGLDLHLTYARLAEAQRCIIGGARFVASNKDRAYPVEGRLLPGAGSIVQALEVATGQQAVCIGKPEPFLFEEAIRRAGAGPTEPADPGPVVVIGDAPEYDIVAAHKVGATGVLITTGLTDRAAAAAATGDAVPDHVIGSLDELFRLPEFVAA
ncbi:MAG TPA: HAD-IIA family hydrolase [Candidatus Limnocylindria bacterium]|nr:HAD-IIA family hydrolase [Candidatus Limnocylindria bacterium]